MSLRAGVFRKTFDRFTDRFVTTPAGSYLNRGLYTLYEYFRFRRSLYQHRQAQQKLETLFADRTVMKGPMAGLRYPSFSSFGSSLFPKLAGTYENELSQVISGLNTQYHVIIDVGCAEGYYAVGLARRFPDATVIAFDDDESARKQCHEMAVINKVESHIQIRAKCTSEWIGSIDRTAKTLIICDCEGCERHLFDENNVIALQHADLIIELHPMYEPDVKEFLTSLFARSHHVEFVSSYDDKRKIFDLTDEYASLSDVEKLTMVQEGRAFSMDWMIIKSLPA